MFASDDVTRLLSAWAGEDQGALDRLLSLVCAELRRIADAHRRRQSADNTLQPTALIREAFLKLRYFGGLSTEEIAEGLNIYSITVSRDWSVARAWLAREMGSDSLVPL